MDVPWSHRSVQKRVLLPSLISAWIDASDIACTCGSHSNGRTAQGLFSSVRLSHSQSSLSAKPAICRSVIPKPPMSRGRAIVRQAMVHCSPAADFSLAQKKPRQLFSIAAIAHCGSLMEIRGYIGIAVIVDLTRANLPDFHSSFAFHAGTHLLTLSTIG